jgi:hypothetical protein
VALKVNKLDVGRMFKELQTSDILEGHLDGDIDVKGQGITVADLMGGLDGKTVLVMGKGRINNKYINLLGGDLSSSIFRLINPFQKQEEYTVLNCFVSGFSIRNGLAETTALVLDTDEMSVIGEGEINLKTETLNIELKPVPKKGLGTRTTGKVSLSLGELAKPFRLVGTLAHPSLGIDATQAALGIGKIVGGITLFGPAGIAAALVSGSSGDENPCLAAIEAAKKGVRSSGEKKGPAEGVTQGVEKGIKGVGKELHKLFGK